MTFIHTPYAINVERNRNRNPGPAIPNYRAGIGYCEGCQTNKPRPPKAMKGWRCQQCKSTEGQ